VWLVPVELPTGAQKQFTLYVLPPSFAQVARVRVMEGTQELAKENASLTLHPNNEYLLGVIAPRIEPFNPIGGTVLGGAVPRTVRTLPLTLNDIPERAEGLRALDGLVLSDADTSALSPAQMRALAIWIQQGGRLVVGGGASAARTLSGLPDELVGEFRAMNGVTELEQVDELGIFTDQPVRVPGPFVAALGSGGMTLLKQNNDVLVSEKRVGNGYVTYSALDLAASPFDAWAGTPQFWGRLLAPNSTYPSNTPIDISPKLVRTRYMATALQNLPVLALPSVGVLTTLLIAYIILVGPVNYFVLRKLKKLDWGWLTIPALTLLFAVGAFGISNQLRGGDVILNQVSIVEFGTDGKAREMETLVGMFSPTRGTFNLEIPAGGLVIPIMNQFDPFSSNPTAGGTSVDVVEGNPLLVRGVQINQGALQAFAVQSPPPPEWRIEGNLKVEGERVRGTIVNRTDTLLSDVIVTVGERFLRLGDLQPNEPVTLDHTWQFYGGQVSNLIGGSEVHDEARRQILNARFDYWRGTQNAPSAPLLLGWMTGSPLDARVQNLNVSREAKTLVLAAIPADYGAGVVLIGANDWNIELREVRGNRSECGSVNYTGVRDGELVLAFRVPTPVHIKNVRKLTFVVRDQPPQIVEIQDTEGAWKPLPFFDIGRFDIANAMQFLKPDGSLHLRISSKDLFDRCSWYSFEMEAEVE
jgi:hypothetical protein